MSQDPATPLHPTTESYLLVTLWINGGSVEVGLHRNRGEPVSVLRSELRRVCWRAIETLDLDSGITEDTAAQIVDSIGAAVSRVWTGRPWWAEVYSIAERITQSYAPYGMPRHQETPTPTGG